MVDGDLVTSRRPADLPAFNQRMLVEFGEGMKRAAPVAAGVACVFDNNCLFTIIHKSHTVRRRHVRCV